MPWDDDSWRDGYDAWKLASPDDERDEECFHEEYEIDVEGRWHCTTCSHRWWPTQVEIAHHRFLNEEYDAHCRREERKAKRAEWIRRLAFWRRWRKPEPIIDDVPF